MGVDSPTAARKTGLLTPAFLASEAFPQAFVAATALLLLGLPLLYACAYHVSVGNHSIGCLAGVIGLAVTAASGWWLVRTLSFAHRLYAA